MHLLDINEIAKKAGIPAEYVEPYGKLKAKVDMKYFDEIKELSSQIRLLTESRDRLLPKLMSGEITV